MLNSKILVSLFANLPVSSFKFLTLFLSYTIKSLK